MILLAILNETFGAIRPLRGGSLGIQGIFDNTVCWKTAINYVKYSSFLRQSTSFKTNKKRLSKIGFIPVVESSNAHMSSTKQTSFAKGPPAVLRTC